MSRSVPVTLAQRKAKLQRIISSVLVSSVTQPAQTKAAEESRLEFLKRLTNMVPAHSRKPPSPSTPNASRSAARLPPGDWCALDWEPNPADVLISVWRAAFRKFRPNQEMPVFEWHLKKHLNKWATEKVTQPQWVEEKGPEPAAIIRFAVENWDWLKFDLDVTDAEAPALNILYGYRLPLERLYSKREKRTWGASLAKWERSDDGNEEVKFSQ